VRALECESGKLRLVRSSGDIVYLHAVGKDCFSRSSNKSKRRARDWAAYSAPSIFSTRSFSSCAASSPASPPAARDNVTTTLNHESKTLCIGLAAAPPAVALGALVGRSSDGSRPGLAFGFGFGGPKYGTCFKHPAD